MKKSKFKIIFGRPDWPLWRVVAAAAIIYGPLSAFLLIIPPYFHASSLTIGFGFLLVGIIALVWGHYSRNPWAHVLGNFTFNFQLLVIAVRAFAVSGSTTWYVLLLLYGSFALAWLLPILSRRMASRAAREIMVPETRVGRLIIGSILTISPAAGAIGASLGLFSSRLGINTESIWFIIALLFTLIAIGWGLKLAFDLAEDYHPAYQEPVT
jgi:hypothetical protein